MDVAPEDLLAKLAEGKIDYVVVDSTQINLAKNFYPNLEVAFDLGEPTGRAWAFSSYADPALLEKARKFFDRIERDGTLMRLLDRYYGHVQRLEQTDVSGILKKRRTLLPNLRELFSRCRGINRDRLAPDRRTGLSGIALEPDGGFPRKCARNHDVDGNHRRPDERYRPPGCTAKHTRRRAVSADAER